MATPSANVENNVVRIKRIRDEFMLTLKELREKIQTLEAEHAILFAEIEDMRQAAESRVASLELEVSQMREEAKSLHELLDGISKETVLSSNLQKSENFD